MLQETTTAAAATGGPTPKRSSRWASTTCRRNAATRATTSSSSLSLTLVIMSIVSWYWIVINLIKNVASCAQRRPRRPHVLGNPERAGRDPLHGRAAESEPFSKIALDCAQAAAHHQRHEGSRLVESLNRSEFVDRALRQAVTREIAQASRTA